MNLPHYAFQEPASDTDSDKNPKAKQSPIKEPGAADCKSAVKESKAITANTVCIVGATKSKDKTANVVRQVHQNKPKGTTANTVRFVDTQKSNTKANKPKPETICLDEVSDTDNVTKSTGTSSLKVPRKSTTTMVVTHRGERHLNIKPPICFCPIVDVNADEEDEDKISMLIDPKKKGYADNQMKFSFPIIKTLARNGEKFTVLRRRMEEEIFYPF